MQCGGFLSRERSRSSLPNLPPPGDTWPRTALCAAQHKRARLLTAWQSWCSGLVAARQLSLVPAHCTCGPGQPSFQGGPGAGRLSTAVLDW